MSISCSAVDWSSDCDQIDDSIDKCICSFSCSDCPPYTDVVGIGDLDYPDKTGCIKDTKNCKYGGQWQSDWCASKYCDKVEGSATTDKCRYENMAPEMIAIAYHPISCGNAGLASEQLKACSISHFWVSAKDDERYGSDTDNKIRFIINWGDGQSETTEYGGFSSGNNGHNAIYSRCLEHVYCEPKNYIVQVWAEDSGGIRSSKANEVRPMVGVGENVLAVDDLAFSICPRSEGSPEQEDYYTSDMDSITVAPNLPVEFTIDFGFSSVDGQYDPYDYWINWGDTPWNDANPTWQNSGTVSGPIKIIHTYSSANKEYHPKIKIKYILRGCNNADDDGNICCSPIFQNFIIKTNNNIKPPQIESFLPCEAKIKTLTNFKVQVSDAESSNLRYSIDFSDGNTCDITNAKTNTVSCSFNNYNSPPAGPISATVRVVDEGGVCGKSRSAEGTFQITLIGTNDFPNEPPTITEITPASDKKLNPGAVEFTITVRDKKRLDGATTGTSDDIYDSFQCTYTCQDGSGGGSCALKGEPIDANNYRSTTYTAVCTYNNPGMHSIVVSVAETSGSTFCRLSDTKEHFVTVKAKPEIIGGNRCVSPNVIGRETIEGDAPTGVDFTVNARDPDGKPEDLRYYIDCKPSSSSGWTISRQSSPILYCSAVQLGLINLPPSTASFTVKIKVCDIDGVCEEKQCDVSVAPDGTEVCYKKGNRQCCDKCASDAAATSFDRFCKDYYDLGGDVCCTSCADACSQKGKCVSPQPKYCDVHGRIVDDSGMCGCPSGYEPAPDGKTCVLLPICREPACFAKNNNRCMCGNTIAPAGRWCCADGNSNNVFSSKDMCTKFGADNNHPSCAAGTEGCSKTCCASGYNCNTDPISDYCGIGKECCSGSCVMCAPVLIDCYATCQCRASLGGCTCGQNCRYANSQVSINKNCGGLCVKSLGLSETCNCMSGCNCPANSYQEGESVGPDKNCGGECHKTTQGPFNQCNCKRGCTCPLGTDKENQQINAGEVCGYKTVDPAGCKEACISGRNCRTDRSCINKCEAECNVASTISYVIKILYAVAAGIAALMITFHGFRWLTADSPETRADAKRGIAFVVLGLIVIAIASTLVHVLYETLCNRVFGPGSCGGWMMGGGSSDGGAGGTPWGGGSTIIGPPGGEDVSSVTCTDNTYASVKFGMLCVSGTIPYVACSSCATYTPISNIYTNCKCVKCLKAGTVIYNDITITCSDPCGDGWCDAGGGETQTTCCQDCGCPTGEGCYTGVCYKTCTSSSDCASYQFCSSTGYCFPKRVSGPGCQSALSGDMDESCLSGNCVGDYCRSSGVCAQFNDLCTENDDCCQTMTCRSTMRCG